MLKKPVDHARCQVCQVKQWCCISLGSGLRRCFTCWAVYFGKREATHA